MLDKGGGSAVLSNPGASRLSDPTALIRKDSYKERGPLFVGSQRFVYVTGVVAPELLKGLELQMTSADANEQFSQTRRDLTDALEQVKTHVRYGNWETQETRTLKEADVETVRTHQKKLRRTMRTAVDVLPYWIECEWPEPIHHGGEDDRVFPPGYPSVMVGALLDNFSESAQTTGQDAERSTSTGATMASFDFTTVNIEPSCCFLEITTEWVDDDEQWHDDEDAKKYKKPVKYVRGVRKRLKESKRTAEVGASSDEPRSPWEFEGSMTRDWDDDIRGLGPFGGNRW